MNCKFCGHPLPDEKTGRRPREYCTDAHRQAHYRRLHQHTRSGEDATLVSSLLLNQLEEAKARIAQLEQAVADLAETRRQLAQAQEDIAELEATVTRLHRQLDLEKRYHEPKSWPFMTWLRKQPPTGLSRRLCADQTIPPRGSRGLYEAHLRRMKCSPEEMLTFTDLWKLMLLSRP